MRSTFKSFLKDFGKILFGTGKTATGRPESAYSAALTLRRVELAAQIARVPWDKYRTAYPPATDVAAVLEQLLFGTTSQADEAVLYLQNALCHQDVEVDSAALPCAPFLLVAFENASEHLALCLLGLMHSCITLEACASDPSRDEWAPLLRHTFAASASTFTPYVNHPNLEIRKSAEDILRELEKVT
jgi:hypothetical protein